MTRWTVEDEINLCKWVEATGFRLCYMPQVEQWGYYHIDKPKEINGGFHKLVDLKQHLVNMKGDNKNVQIISEGDFQRAVETLRRISKYH